MPSRFQTSTAVVIAAMILVLGMPAVGRGALFTAHDVDLSRISLTQDCAAAPIRGGGTAVLSLDPRLQRTARRLLALARPVEGAVVLADVRSGGVLVWAEFGQHAGGKTGDILTRARAPTASLFKIVTTAALLERKVSPKRRVCYAGGHHQIETIHLDAPSRDEHPKCRPFSEALGFSRNAVYAQLASRFLDAPTLEKVATRLGFGSKVPMDVDAEVGHIDLPDEPLAFARAAAGFRDSTISPAGAAHLLYTIALRGRPGRLHLVERAAGYVAPARREVLGRTLPEPVAYELRRMLEGSVHAGTSLHTFTDSFGQNYLGDIRVAAKTGTLRQSKADPTTTWFAGFAPSSRPRVVVSVLVRNGPVWRRKANEIGRDILRTYFASQGARGVTAPFED